MTLHSAFCREREAIELDRASSATLENVRIIATRAAGVWAQTATRAERLEAAASRRLVALSPAADTLCEPSENPDRGRAT